MSQLDRRTNAFREDLADIRLQHSIDAARYVEGRAASVTVPVVDVMSRPDEQAGMDTQFLLGDELLVFERKDDWAWVQGKRDSYVGYIRHEAVSTSAPEHTHRITVPRTFAYAEPDMKRPVTRILSMGCRITVEEETETRGLCYVCTGADEWLVADHLEKIYAVPVERDYVATAKTLLHTPYLWGGVSAFGIDCSGLVQLSLMMSGRDCPRDTDMQEKQLGRPIDHANLKRGDLVFWKGHVAIMTDDRTIIHANGHTMSVALEPLDEAIERIGYLYGQPTAYRRL